MPRASTWTLVGGLLVVCIAPVHAESFVAAGTGPGWILLDVDATEPGVAIGLRMLASRDGGPALIRIYEDGTFLASYSAWINENTVELTAETPATPRLSVRTFEGPTTMGAAVTFAESGNYTALLIAGGQSDSWGYFQRGEGVAVREISSGNRVFAGDAGDMQEGASATAGAVLPGAGVGVGRMLPLDVRGVLIGQVDTPDPFRAAAGDMRIEGPQAHECPCRMDALWGPEAAPPGQYTFHFTGAHVHAARGPTYIFADVNPGPK